MNSIKIGSILLSMAFLASCGTSSPKIDNEMVKTINTSDPSKLTSEQQEYAIDVLLQIYDEQIANLKEAIANADNRTEEGVALLAAMKIYSAAKEEDSEPYKKAKDEIIKNSQEINRLREEKTKAQFNEVEELGYTIDEAIKLTVEAKAFSKF